MTQSFDKSLETIELARILEMLSEQAISETAKERALALYPSSSSYEVKHRLSETTAASTMMVLRGSPALTGVKDVRASLNRATMSGVLNTRELLDIAAVLTAARQARAYGAGEGRGTKTCIDHYFASLRSNKNLEERIISSISSEEELSDAASSELADIRRKMRAAAARVREAIQKIISSPTYAKALQDTVITTRSDRYVVQVKADHKSAVPGLVHDVSSSGATLFVEPMAAVKANNEIRELKAKEKAEIERILMELSALCADNAVDISEDFEILVRIDLIFAKAKLSYKMEGIEPNISEREILLKKARHPLLDRKTAVPIDVELGGDYDTMVITGPNTGGKTVSIKTIGLLCAMTACGLHIPVADGSAVPVLTGILADIGDEQSIEQSLSTFSSHMTNIVKMLEHCDSGTLILFDELGAGTDPVEGAALAIAIIEHARSKSALIAATTHYSELKIYATTELGVINASCEFDVETLSPTYKLILGIPGKSNAFAISEKLGLPVEIINDARTRLGADSLSFEESLAKLEETRHRLEREYEDARQNLRQAEAERDEAARLRIELTKRLERAGEAARRESEKIISEARSVAENVFAELDIMRKRVNEDTDHKLENEQRTGIRSTLNRAGEEFSKKPNVEAQKRKNNRAAKLGDTVEILSMGVNAEVVGIEKDGKLNLAMGSMKMKLKQDEVYVLDNQPKKQQKNSYSAPLRTSSQKSELDIRGMETLEAIPVVEMYIDSAHLSQLESVSIIHGKGTGALRKAVHENLKRNKMVKSFRLGAFGEGDSGVTIVKLK